MNSAQILDREYLEIRARLLELAACFDRLDRAEGGVEGDVRLSKIDEALKLLLSGEKPDRAEQLQLIFSRQYDENWRSNFNLS